MTQRASGVGVGLRSGLRLAHPLAFLLLGLAGLAGLAACGGEPPRAERVVLVTIDTLRADHVGAYGDEGARTPNLDALAAAGARFDAAISPVPLTLPSHTTLMTGLQPDRHGVRHNSIHRLREDVPTLAEQLKAHGMATAAFVAAFVLDAQFGLARGFDVYDDELGFRRAADSIFAFAERPGDQVVDGALAWLEGAPDRFFLWVHLYDPHADYRAPPGFSVGEPDPYAAEIAFTDAQVGRLLRAVEARWDDGTAVVVTSDHGESRGEHGERTHSYFVYQGTQWVPLLLRAPGVPPGAVVPDVVRLADVAPTLIDLAGAAPLPDAEGRSLLPLARGEPDPGRVAYMETVAPELDLDLSPLRAVREGRWKYVRAPRPELYDLAEDPGELRDLATEQPEQAVALDAHIDARGEAATPATLAGGLEAGDRARLEALGYVVPEAEAEQDIGRVGGRDPKDYVELAEAQSQAGNLVSQGRAREALELLAPWSDAGRRGEMLRVMAALGAGEAELAERVARRMLEDRSERQAHVLLATALLAQGRIDEARRETEAAVAHGDPLPALQARLALAEGDRDRARELYGQMLEEDPRSELARVGLAVMRIEDGDHEGGLALLADLPAEVLDRPSFAARLAQAELGAGQAEAAADRLDRALARHPRATHLLAVYSDALEAAGRSDETLRVLEELHAQEPENPVLANNLAYALARAGRDLDRALELATTAAEALDRHPSVLDTLAFVHLARGEHGRVTALTQEALAAADGESTSRAHLLYLQARAQMGLGETGAAREALRRSLAASTEADAAWLEQARALQERVAPEGG